MRSEKLDMEKRKKRQDRKPWARTLFIVFLCFSLLSIGIFFWFGDIHAVGSRMTVVLVGDPVTIVSRDATDGSFLVVSIPAQAVVESVHGYGQYSLESLWKLGSIEGRAGMVLSQSVEELFGVPMPWYVGRNNHTLVGKSSDPLTLVKSVFSFRLLSEFFRGAFVTNMSPREFLTFAWAFSQRRPDNIKIIDVAHTLLSKSLPDGSSVMVAVPNSIDQAVGNAFEDSVIRKEGLSVAVFNTTAVPTLGTRVSRMLSHAGMFVVLVGNDRPTIGACAISGGKKELASRTAAFIVVQYGCRKAEGMEPRADLTVRIGTDYQGRFLPFMTK